MTEDMNSITIEQATQTKHSTLGHWVAIIIILVLLGVSALMNIGLIAMLVTENLGTSDVSSKYTEELIQGKGRKKVVCIEAFGIISLAKDSSGFFREPGLATRIIKQIDEAEKDDNVIAILLLVDSPGGGVTASDIIYERLLKFKSSKKGRKVVALFRDIAASGGYYISAAADKIVAHRTTITGSIGVILSSYNVKELGEKIGIKDVTIKSGKYKDILNPFRDASPEEIQMLQNVVNDLYNRFVSIVSRSRGMNTDEVRKFANGSIFSAPHALTLGLIDEIGGFDSTVNLLKELTGTKKFKVVRYKKALTFFEIMMSGMNANPKIDLPFPDRWKSQTPGFKYLWQPEL